MGLTPRARGGMHNRKVRITRAMRAIELRGTAPKTLKSLNHDDAEQEEGPSSENYIEDEGSFEPPHTFKCTVQITFLDPNQGSIEELKKSIQRKFLIMVAPFETVLKARKRAITMFLNFEGLPDDNSIDETHFSNLFTDEYGEVADNYIFGHVFGKSSQVFMTYSRSSKDITQPIEKIPLHNSHTIHSEEFTQQSSVSFKATAPTISYPSAERAVDVFEQISSDFVVSPTLRSISEVPIAHSVEDLNSLQDFAEPQSLVSHEPPSPTISKAVTFREPLHSLSLVSERNGEHDVQSLKSTNSSKLGETNAQVSNHDWHTPTPEACELSILEMRPINNLQESSEQEEVAPSPDISKENMLLSPASPCYESDSSAFTIWDNLSNNEFGDETIIKEHRTDDDTSNVLLSDSDDEKIDLTHNSPPTDFNISKSFDGESLQYQDQSIPVVENLSTLEISGEGSDRPQNVTHSADSEILLERKSSPDPQVEYSHGLDSFGSKVDSAAQSFVSELDPSSQRESIAKPSQEAEREFGAEPAHDSLSMIDSGSGSSDSSDSGSEKEFSKEPLTQSTQAIVAEPLQALESKAITQESVPEATQSNPKREHSSESESEEESASDSESESEEESSSVSERESAIELDCEPPQEADTELHQLPKIALPTQELFTQSKPEPEEGSISDSGSDSESSSNSGSDSEISSESETEKESELIQVPIFQSTQKFVAEPKQELGSVAVSPQSISEPKGSSGSESGSESSSDSEGSSDQESGTSSDEVAKTEPTIASISNPAQSIPKTTSPKLVSSQRANVPSMARHSLKRSIMDEPIETPVPLGQIHPSYFKSIKSLPSKDKYFDEVMVKKFKNSTKTPSILSQNSLVMTSIDLNSPSASGSEIGGVGDSSSDASSDGEQVESQASNKSMLLDFLKS